MNYATSPLIVYDLEVFKNFFLAGFQLPDGKIYQFRHSDLLELKHFLKWIQDSDYTLAGWNSKNYDDPVLSEFLDNPFPLTAYLVSHDIIVDQVKPWNFLNSIWSIDLKAILPGNLGLKKIGVCLGHPKLQELPIAFDKELTESEMELIEDYNQNDLLITRKVAEVLQPELDLRGEMSRKYGIDLRSKGEAQIAESILISESNLDSKSLKSKAWDNISLQTDLTVQKPKWWHALRTFQYAIINRVTSLATEIFNTPLSLSPEGRIAKGSLSNWLYLGDKFYQLGVGGLHSVDGAGSWVPKKDELLIDIDVTSFYPNIILTQGLHPRHWGIRFLEVYQSIVERRVEAKRIGDKTIAAVLKICANGTFGKTSDPYSALFDPEVTVNVTVTGQLALLILIGMLANREVQTVSANTDGVTVLLKKSNFETMKNTVAQWEDLTGFSMEYTHYRGFYQLDVNNYIAHTTEGDLKTKGRFSAPVPGKYDLRHTPNFRICARAIQEYILYKTPVESTIFCCTDINQFILTQQVVGNWTTSWDGKPLGKMLRFYKSNSPEAQPILRHPGEGVKGNEGQVTNSDNAVPLENLPETFPNDILYSWYIDKAHEWLAAIQRPHTLGGNRKANKLIEEGLHPVIQDLDSPRRSRARPPLGTLDFNSLQNNDAIGIVTGNGVIAKLVDNQTRKLYSTEKEYPGKTRKKVLKDAGFELIYGGAVDPGPGRLENENDWDDYYTETELKKVRT